GVQTCALPIWAAVCRDERARLMWIGRGLWFDLDFYRRFEETHGAVFVWSMYLAIAADGYLRYGDDPLRALAARFATFSDQLYTPPWSVEWYVKEARHHGVDGVVHLVSDDPRGSWFTTRGLEAAGFPVLELHADNVDARTTDPDTLDRQVRGWLDEVVLPRAAGARGWTARRAGADRAPARRPRRRARRAVHRVRPPHDHRARAAAARGPAWRA